MTGGLAGKVALVTGGARGIGAATCVGLARRGAAVLVTDVLDKEGRAVADTIGGVGGVARYRHLDVASEAAWADAIRDAVGAWGGLHILVNNAGIARLEDVESETAEGYRRILEVNQFGCWLGMKAAAPILRRSGGGAIVNVSSIYGAVGGDGTAIAYHASKGAMRQMTKNAAVRYAKEGIRVLSVHPGFIDTPMVAPYLTSDASGPSPFRRRIEDQTPMGRLGRSEEVANVIAFVASDEASYMTGTEIFVDGGWTAV